MSAPRRFFFVAAVLLLAGAAIGCAPGADVQAGSSRPAPGVVATTAPLPDAGTGAAATPSGAASGGGGQASVTTSSTPARTPAGSVSTAAAPAVTATAPRAPAPTTARRRPPPLPELDIRGHLTVTSPGKVAGGANMPVVSVRAHPITLAGGTSKVELAGDTPVVFTSVEIRIPAKGLGGVKTGVGKCVLQAAEYVCAAGPLGNKTQPFVELVAAEGAKGTVTFHLVATTDDQAVYAGTLDVPLPEGS
jgi:hypothetical protein